MPYKPCDAVRVGGGAEIQMLIRCAIRSQLDFPGDSLEKPHDDLVHSDLLAAHSSSLLVVPVVGRTRRTARTAAKLWKRDELCNRCTPRRRLVLQQPGGYLRTRPQAKLAQNVLHVNLDGPLADDQRLSNFSVASSCRQQHSHIAFSATEVHALRACQPIDLRSIGQTERAIERRLHIHLSQLPDGDIQVSPRLH